MISQYDNSPKLNALVTGLKNAFNDESVIKDWYNVVFNIKTASGYGLDVWGRILNVSRKMILTTASAEYPEVYELSDAEYRLVLFLATMGYISNGSLADLNKMLKNYFQDRGVVFFEEVDTMHIRLVFEFFITPYELAILKLPNILPTPTGVQTDIEFIVPDVYLGFNGSGLLPFDKGVFFGEYKK